MADTIEQLAFETYPVVIEKTMGPLPGQTEMSEKDVNLYERNAFIKGANEVLNIMEQAAEMACRFGDTTYVVNMNCVWDKISELRGK